MEVDCPARRKSRASALAGNPVEDWLKHDLHPCAKSSVVRVGSIRNWTICVQSPVRSAQPFAAHTRRSEMVRAKDNLSAYSGA